jgi:hypothetical protein
MGRRPFPAEVPQRASGQFVTPDMRIQKRSRQGAAHAADVISEVQVSQRLGRNLGDVGLIPTAADCHNLFAGHNHRVFIPPTL